MKSDGVETYNLAYHLQKASECTTTLQRQLLVIVSEMEYNTPESVAALGEIEYASDGIVKHFGVHNC